MVIEMEIGKEDIKIKIKREDVNMEHFGLQMELIIKNVGMSL